MAEQTALATDLASPDTGAVLALVADPVAADCANVWQVGLAVSPSVPDPAAARAARLEARLAVYAQYAAVVADEAAATVAGDEERRTALREVRGAAAEHFAELREAALAAPDDLPPVTAFADALTDALHELRHQQAVDGALGRRLRALHNAATLQNLVPALTTGADAAPRIDVRF